MLAKNAKELAEPALSGLHCKKSAEQTLPSMHLNPSPLVKSNSQVDNYGDMLKDDSVCDAPHHSTRLSERRYQRLCPIANPPMVSALRVQSKRFECIALYLHIKFGHLHHEYIQCTGQLGQSKGIPKDIAQYDINCPICKLASATKLPCCQLKDTTELRKGSRFHADWIIINTESCRGFKTALLITESTTKC